MAMNKKNAGMHAAIWLSQAVAALAAGGCELGEAYQCNDSYGIRCTMGGRQCILSTCRDHQIEESRCPGR